MRTVKIIPDNPCTARLIGRGPQESLILLTMIVWEVFGVNLMHPEVCVDGFAALYSPPFHWKIYEVTVVSDSYLVSLRLRD